MSVTEGQLLWTPSPERVAAARLTDFAAYAESTCDVQLPAQEPERYAALHAWSVSDLDGFWSALWQWAGLPGGAPRPVLTDTVDGAMPGARWFPETQLNYAQVALARTGDTPALHTVREDGREVVLTRDELRAAVGAAAAGLRRLGVGRGDRVAAVLPNAEHAAIAFLATANLGAVWTSCSPDFGVRGLVDRFAQVEPVVLLGVDGYTYGGKGFDTRDTLAQVQAALPSLKATVVVPWLADQPDLSGLADVVPWAELVAEAAPVEPVELPAETPLWILYSSGTTGLPKPIVQSHGGIVVEHVKQLALHLDLGEGDRFTWFTTCGWMMWNLLVSGLLVGATVVTYDGNPGHPDLGTLWRVADRAGVTHFGVSAPFIHACLAGGLVPSEVADTSRIRVVGSTGAPLSPEGFRWLYDTVGDDVLVASVSGGTDLCTAFVVSVPTLPVHAGELQGPALGAAVAVLDDAGNRVLDTVGELVITRPMPSMPLYLWGDDDGSRLRETYYCDFPGRWRHGDWAQQVGARGSFVIHGRSDSTLNRGGVRIGTAEFYRVVEDDPSVVDSLVVDTGALGREGELQLYVVLADGVALDDALVGRLRSTLRRGLSPRHVPDLIEAIGAVPKTLNGKKLEVPVKKLLSGVPVSEAVALAAVADPSALDPFLAKAAARR